MTLIRGRYPSFSDKSQVKSKKTISKLTQAAVKKKKPKSPKDSSTDDGTSTSDFSATSMDSSAISFPTEVTSATSETSQTSHSRQKLAKKKPGCKKFGATSKRPSHYLPRPSLLQNRTCSDTADRPQRRLNDKSPVAFGRTIPRLATSNSAPSEPQKVSSVSVKSTVRTNQPSVGKIPARKSRKIGRNFKRVGATSDGTSAEFSISLQNSTDHTDESTEGSASTDDDGDSEEVNGVKKPEVRPRRSAEDIVKALASKWQAEKASGSGSNGRTFASNSQTFSTSDLRNLQLQNS